MRAARVFETILYVDDLEAAEAFYSEVLGLEVLVRGDLLLSFRHVAFALPQDEIEAWRAHLAEKGVEIEQEVEWEVGGLSLYFRDPSGNSIELAPPTLWGGDWNF